MTVAEMLILVGDNPERIQSEAALAKLCGVCPIPASRGKTNGSAYYLLTSLVEKGSVKIDNFKKSPRKSRYVYLITPKGIREKGFLTCAFIDRKREELELLREKI